MVLKGKLCSFFWMISVLLFTPYSSVQAMEITNSNLNFSNFQIQPTIGTVVLSSDWFLDSFSEARNSLGQVDQQSPANNVIFTQAAVTWANSQGGAAANFPPDLNVTANALSNIALPGVEDGYASASGRGTLYNEFTITGGTGFVGVDFSALMQGSMNVITDQWGSVQTEVISNFEIFGPLLDGQDSVLLFHQDKFSIGPNSAVNKAISETLSTTRTLEFDVPYSFVIEVNSDSFAVATVPEPPIIALMLISLCLWAGFARHRQCPSSHHP